MLETARTDPPVPPFGGSGRRAAVDREVGALADVERPRWASAVTERILGMRAENLGWREIGRRLHLPPGKVYLIATGRPADGGHALTEDERARLGDGLGTTQDLVNPPEHNPTSTDEVHAWLRRRAARELTHAGADHA
jgi:hypothetical protein